MAPPERKNMHGHRSMSSGSGNPNAGNNPNDSNNNSNDQHQQHQQAVDTAENIDHILDNMFVQRSHSYQSATGLAPRKSSSPVPIDVQQVNNQLNKLKNKF